MLQLAQVCYHNPQPIKPVPCQVNNMIKIQPFCPEHYEQVSDILFDAFRSKFEKLTNLEESKLRGFVRAAGPGECDAGTWVAELDGRIVGIISLKWNGMDKGKPARPLQLGKLIHDYGLLNTIRFYTGMALLQEALPEGECYVEHIAVSAQARGMGVGHQLLDFGQEVATAHGLSRYTLNVALSNPRARALYEKMGFGVTKKVTSWLTKLFINETGFYYMVKPLTEAAVGLKKWRLKKHWGLGFFGLIGILALPGVWTWLQGEGSASHLPGLLWFLFFDYFVPERK